MPTLLSWHVVGYYRSRADIAQNGGSFGRELGGWTGPLVVLALQAERQ